MSVEELEVGKCYRVIFRKALIPEVFKVETIKTKHYNKAIIITIEGKGLHCEGDTMYVCTHRSFSQLPQVITDFEEIDESIVDKTIKYFYMTKAVISATINQESNETQRNTTQGDYQLP